MKGSSLSVKKLETEWRALLSSTIACDQETSQSTAAQSLMSSSMGGNGSLPNSEGKCLPVFVASYDTSKTPMIRVYSLSKNCMVGEYSMIEIQGDFWEQAGELLGFVANASRRFILLPLVKSPSHRKVVEPPMKAFTTVLNRLGVQPIVGVDSLVLDEMISKKGARASSLLSLSDDAKLGTDRHFFEQYWSNLRTKLCHAVDDDPLVAINTYIAPQYDVYTIHLVRTGSQGLGISLWSPVRKKRFSSKGMLPDILACLFQTGSTSMILIPTARTDRLVLSQCRVALNKAGKTCRICYATSIHDKCRSIFQADPQKLWQSMCELFNSFESDLLFKTYESVGTKLREEFERQWSEDSRQAYIDKHVSSSSLPTQSDVKVWQKVFRLPQRIVSEVKESKHYERYLVVAYTSTELTVYCQPRNPIAEENYIVAACLSDNSGMVLQPWVKYVNRKASFRFPSLAEYSVIVAYDAKRLLLLCSGDKELDAFFKRGGRVWCTMLAEYLLEAQRVSTGQNSLSEVSMRYGFLLPPQCPIGAVPESLSIGFHRTHLLSAVSAMDAVFKAQLKRGREQMQLVSLAHRMDSLLAMEHMERNGICVDVKEAEQQNNELKNSLVVMDHTLEAHIPSQIPTDLRLLFDWASLPHLHALMFGGQIELGDSGAHRSRDSFEWAENLLHLVKKYATLSNASCEVHLKRFASLADIRAEAIPKLVTEVSHCLDKRNGASKKFRIVIFDIETTGLNPSTDEIIEIALYDPVSGSVFQSLACPKRPINPRTVDIHHITEEEVKEAPPLEKVVKGVAKFLRIDGSKGYDPNEIILMFGHNVFAIDEPMLRRALNRYLGDPKICDRILFCDSLSLLRGHKIVLQKKMSKRSERKKLTQGDKHIYDVLSTSLRLPKLIENLGLTPDGEVHRAETDTKALWRVMVDVFELTQKTVVDQCECISARAAESLSIFPAAGCFVPHTRICSGISVTLPGIAKNFIDDARLVKSLQKKVLNEELLSTLQTHGVEVAGLLIKRQRLERMAPRFLDPHTSHAQSTLHADLRIRQHIDMTSTVTSRTSSAYPSCQNLPKEGPTRRLFVSRYGSEGRCVEVDYSQLEIVILAILSGDKKLVSDLKNGIDFHIKRAEFFSGIPYKQIQDGYQRGVPKYVKLRKMAKQFSFQRLYGAGVSLLHKTTGIAVKDLKQSIRLEEEEYPGISEFYRTVRAVALRENNPGLPTGYIVELPTGCRIHYKTRDVVLNLPPVKNYPIQAFGAELSQLMLGRLLRHFIKKDFYKNKARIVNFVHDSVWLDCHKDVVKECVRDTCRIMSSVHEYVPSAFPGVLINLPLKVSASSGVNMYVMETVPPNEVGKKES